jgi:hypothetical protein
MTAAGLGHMIAALNGSSEMDTAVWSREEIDALNRYYVDAEREVQALRRPSRHVVDRVGLLRRRPRPNAAAWTDEEMRTFLSYFA